MPPPRRDITAAGASQAGDQRLPPSTATGEAAPAPGSQVAVAKRGRGCDPLHRTQRPPLSLVSSALEPCRVSPSLFPACDHAALRYQHDPVVLMFGDLESLVSWWYSASQPYT